jgi:hypothetical protein
LLVDDAVMYSVDAVLTLIVTVPVAADVETDVLSIGATKIGFVTVAVLIAGEVNVLFVRVSVVARPTRVSVAVGSVTVPVFEIVEIVGDVKVRPAIVVTVAPDAIDVLPIVGAA